MIKLFFPLLMILPLIGISQDEYITNVKIDGNGLLFSKVEKSYFIYKSGIFSSTWRFKSEGNLPIFVLSSVKYLKRNDKEFKNKRIIEYYYEAKFRNSNSNEIRFCNFKTVWTDNFDSYETFDLIITIPNEGTIKMNLAY